MSHILHRQRAVALRPLALVSVAYCAAAVGFAAEIRLSSCEVRRAHSPDQTPEWTQRGYVPGWTVRVGKGDSSEIDITGDERGEYRGLTLIGRRWTPPAALPASVRVQLKFQTYCALNAPRMPRAGSAWLAIFTPERWARLADAPRDAQPLNLRAAAEGLLAVWAIHRDDEDVTDWRAWESPELAPAMRELAGREIVLAVVWGCNHFNQPEWGKFADWRVVTRTSEELDRELLAALDPKRPELAAVRAALARDELNVAKAAFVDYLRTRATPCGPPLSPDGSSRGVRAADDICDHVFQLVGCPPTKLGSKILWNEDPHNYEQWAISLNRHAHWVTLGRAYAATKDERYAREFVAQLNSWIDAMPVRINRWTEGPFVDEGRPPLSLDAGIRMADSWWSAYYYFKDSPSFDVSSQFRMVRSFRDHARYLMDARTFHPTSNWGAMEQAGLLHIAVMLPEFSEAAEWLATAQQRLAEAASAQVYPDGAQIELATGYHGVTLRNFLSVLELARRNQLEPPAQFVSGLEKMFDYYVAIAMPDGRTPAVNDGSWGSVGGFLRTGHELFPNRLDFQYFATDRLQGEPPPYTSRRLPYAGWNVMRTGWKPEDHYLFFETGPFGAAHQHEDHLGIIVHAGKKTILTEGGNYSYDQSEWRKYILSTRAHNTVLVDGCDQNRRGKKETFVVDQPRDGEWFTDAGFDYASGVYDCGYGPANEVSVIHRRQVIHVKPDYWLVLDTLTPQDGKEHRYEALFHLDAPSAAVDERTRSVAVDYDGHAFHIMPVPTDGLRVEIIQGQTAPTVQGWLPTGKHNELRPIPTAVYRWSSSQPSTAAFLLLPHRANEPRPVATVQRTAGAANAALGAVITLADGRRDVLRYAADESAWSGVSLERQSASGESRRVLRPPMKRAVP